MMIIIIHFHIKILIFCRHSDSIVDSMAVNVRLKFLILPRPTAHLEIALGFV
jgi:hypothetical protein